MKLIVEENILLDRYTTFKIGGPSRYFVRIENKEEAQEALAFARKKKIPLLILGSGSNIVVSDKGFRGLTILNDICGVEWMVHGDEVALTAGAGGAWDEVVRHSVLRGYAGIECISGVPGTVGGAIVQNANCYGQTTENVVVEVRTIECSTGNEKVFSREECEFEYRSSIFRKHPQAYFITRAVLKLKAGGVPTVSYHDVIRYFKEQRTTPTLRGVRDAIIAIRAKKRYLIMPGVQADRTAGSFFKNPVVSEEGFSTIEAKVLKEKEPGVCEPPWSWELAGGEMKISVACLLEKAGFRKGFRSGNVGISPTHALSLIAYDGATAEEIRNLCDTIKQEVKRCFGVTLEEEVQFISPE